MSKVLLVPSMLTVLAIAAVLTGCSKEPEQQQQQSSTPPGAAREGPAAIGHEGHEGQGGGSHADHEPGEARQWAAGRMAFLFLKVQSRCEEIFKAMISRGFGSDIKISGLRNLSLGDWAAGAVALSIGTCFLIW